VLGATTKHAKNYLDLTSIIISIQRVMEPPAHNELQILLLLTKKRRLALEPLFKLSGIKSSIQSKKNQE
jgi:hypothetical protein